MQCTCGKVFVKMEKLIEFHSKELMTPLVDTLTFLGKVISELNQFRKNLLKSRLSEKMGQLATNVPVDSTFLFENGLNNYISEINSPTILWHRRFENTMQRFISGNLNNFFEEWNFDANDTFILNNTKNGRSIGFKKRPGHKNVS